MTGHKVTIVQNTIKVRERERELKRAFITIRPGAMSFGAPTSSPANGWQLMLVAKDNEAARTLTWNSVFVGVGEALKAATTAGKWMYFRVNITPAPLSGMYSRRAWRCRV